MKTSVRGGFETITFAYMNIGATHMLELAEYSEEGQLYNVISCIIFSAFTLEAYFNHLGSLRHDDWSKVERKLPKLKKYKKFCDELGITPDFNKRPYKSVVSVFKFRDTMAHGKTSTDEIQMEIEVELGNINHFSVGPTWKDFATLKNAKVALNDIQQVIKELHLAAGLEDNPFSSSGSGLLAVQM
ncbi:hypothetical protein A3Q34_01150 [Colwellia sp. PAMC 20917]|uniref:hypothetical protein n=1 Tax=Colwellia sp. PAMC 20917 TaxID=1816218 RepID=UPI0008786295|nr:hypothetical protein [Colwellia sp. PAMC 20917]AOW75609.1 hypothetical protein A3Q34_01150 [Colwellia sp. PAMC 20917]